MAGGVGDTEQPCTRFDAERLPGVPAPSLCMRVVEKDRCVNTLEAKPHQHGGRRDGYVPPRGANLKPFPSRVFAQLAIKLRRDGE